MDDIKWDRSPVASSRWIIWANETTYERLGLRDYGSFAECVSYINQVENGDDTLDGEWFYPDDDELIVYTGSFGSDHSPGSSRNTMAEIYRTKADFDKRVRELESYPEYIGD